MSTNGRVSYPVIQRENEDVARPVGWLAGERASLEEKCDNIFKSHSHTIRDDVPFGGGGLRTKTKLA